MKKRKIGIFVIAMLCVWMLAGCSSEAAALNEEGLKKYSEGSYSEAVNCFERAIVADNQNPEYHVNKGMAYLELEDYSGAHNCFDAALRLDKENQQAYRGSGITYMEEGNYEEAMEALNAALACESGRVSEAEYDILFYRGETQTRMGDYDGAVETYTVLLETQGEQARTYYLRGVANVKGGQINAGLSDMDKAIALNKTDYNMYLNCYYCLADAGEEEYGINYLKTALTVGENTTASHKSRGAVHFLLGDYSAALSEFEYEKDKADVETLIYIGLCYQALEDYTSSYEAFSQALAQGGENVEVYYQMGMCMFSTGEHEKALEYLLDGLEMGGGAHKQEMMYMQALCCERTLQFSEALKTFESYVALYGSTEELDREIAFLQTR